MLGFLCSVLVFAGKVVITSGCRLLKAVRRSVDAELAGGSLYPAIPRYAKSPPHRPLRLFVKLNADGVAGSVIADGEIEEQYAAMWEPIYPEC
jgi:hypothetical protein